MNRAIAPGCTQMQSLYLTNLRSYDIISQGGELFSIIDDESDGLICAFKDCAHLPKGKQWTIVNEQKLKTMLHISQNWYLDVCPECFILQEKYIIPETRIVNGVEVANKNAGEVSFRNQTFHAKHEDVMRKLMTIGLRHVVEKETEVFFTLMKDVESKFEDILKLKRGYERW